VGGGWEKQFHRGTESGIKKVQALMEKVHYRGKGGTKGERNGGKLKVSFTIYPKSYGFCGHSNNTY